MTWLKKIEQREREFCSDLEDTRRLIKALKMTRRVLGNIKTRHWKTYLMSKGGLSCYVKQTHLDAKEVIEKLEKGEF